jgi:hypothetical protein
MIREWLKSFRSDSLNDNEIQKSPTTEARTATESGNMHSIPNVCLLHMKIRTIGIIVWIVWIKYANV